LSGRISEANLSVPNAPGLRELIRFRSGGYTRMMKDHGITISMSRKGNPWDNAACESFMKTLKHEEVHRPEYRTMADARARIGRFLA
jgi:putative transposase